jgi:hypothetical protein
MRRRFFTCSALRTEFDLDLVQIEKVVPEYAEDIREYGKIAYERR